MLRIGHRFSKDIDLFVPDPQYLGYANPRLSELAEGISADYVENAESINLILDDGEIDIVVGTPLTAHPLEMAEYQGLRFRVESMAPSSYGHSAPGKRCCGMSLRPSMPKGFRLRSSRVQS